MDVAPAERAVKPRPQLVIAGYSAWQTRVNALTTRQSTFFAKMMDHPNSVYPSSRALGAQVG
jgi:hypothetical protein